MCWPRHNNAVQRTGRPVHLAREGRAGIIGRVSLALGLILALFGLRSEWLETPDSSAPVLAQDRPLVARRIRYHIPEADQVYLVWGVDGWTTVSEPIRPAGTFIQDKVMYTPMSREGDAFLAEIRAPVGSTLNYGFMTTKAPDGTDIKVWDWHPDHQLTPALGADIEAHAPDSVIQQIVGRETSPTNGSQVPSPWPILAMAACVFLVAILAAAWFVRGYARRVRYGRRSKRILLAAILIVAAVLRLRHISQPYNDAYSWRQASTAMIAENYYRTNWNIFYPEVNWTGPGPNYQGREFQTVGYTAAMLYRLFGQQDWIGRGVAVAFGLWGIWALYQLVRRVWDEERAISSAAIMAILPGSIFVERSFLPDPAMVALATTTVWMWVAYLQTEQKRYFFLTIAVGAWAFLTKLPGMLVGLPMAYATFVILRRRERLNLAKLSLAGRAALAILAPVVAYYLWARHLALTYPPHHFAGSANWVWVAGLRHWVQQSYFLPRLTQRIHQWLWTLPGVAVALLGLCLRPVDADRDPQEGKAPLLFHWWLVGGILYYIIGARELVDNPWNLHIITPAVAALAGHALISIASVRRRIAWSPASAATVMGLLLVVAGSGQSGLKWAYKAYADEGYKLGLALRKAAKSGELVVTMAGAIGDPTAIYYSRQRGWVFPPYPSQPPQDDDEAIRLFEGLRVQGADWLGIVAESRDDLWRDYPELAEHILSTCELYEDTPDYVIYRILAPEQVTLVR